MDDERDIREERYFDARGVILKVLFLLLFVFLLLWLAPLPNKKQVNGTLFNENVENMKDAAKSYYTLERLPQNVGDKEMLSLKEMLEMKLILPFLDSNGKACNIDTSYVEITKMDTEYILKTYLDCESNTDYVIEHIGCYDVCSVFDCTNGGTSSVTKYLMEKTIYGNGWSSWSDWTSTYKSKDSETDRESRKVYTAKTWVEGSHKVYEYETKTLTQEEATYVDDKVLPEVTEPMEESATLKLVSQETRGTGEYETIRTPLPDTEEPMTTSDTIKYVGSYNKTVQTSEYTLECDWDNYDKKVTIDYFGPKVETLYPDNCASYRGTTSIGWDKYKVYDLYDKKEVYGEIEKTYYKYEKVTQKEITKTYYTYKTLKLVTPEPEEDIDTIWTTNKNLPVTTTTKTVNGTTIKTTTRYTKNEKTVNNGDGDYVAESPTIYYTSISKFKSGYVLDQTKTQYRYKYKKSTKSTPQKWIEESELQYYLDNGWTKIKQETIKL